MIKSIQASAAERNCFSLLWTLICCQEFNSTYMSADKFAGVGVSFFGQCCHNTPSWVCYPQPPFDDFILYLWQSGACSTHTKTLQSGFDAQPRNTSACRCIASKWTLRLNSRVVFLQQACSWVVAARSESKGSKALHDDCGCIYPSRPCSQVELLQCGCSRKLVWISLSVKWFDA